MIRLLQMHIMTGCVATRSQQRLTPMFQDAGLNPWLYADTNACPVSMPCVAVSCDDARSLQVDFRKSCAALRTIWKCYFAISRDHDPGPVFRPSIQHA